MVLWSHFRRLLERCRWGWLGLPVLLLTASLAVAQPRTALVIGNAGYAESPLNNPVNDARGVARILRDLDFEVIEKVDLDRRDFHKTVSDFAKRLRQRGGVGLFYYSGHGAQVDGQNYLLPVDATIRSAADVEYEAVNAGRVLRNMEQAGNGLNIVILDACRNNPYRGWYRSAGSKGLARMDAPTGSIVAYATAPGTVAADGSGGHSPYTAHLLDAMRAPGMSIERVFKQVRIDVMKATGNQQVPWESSSLTGDFFFIPPAGPGSSVSTDRPVPPRLEPAPDPQVVQLASLLRTCELHRRANRLTTGVGGNAVDCYQDVLRQDATNEQALEGLAQVAERYAGWAEAALKRGDRSKADVYLERLRKVNPEHPQLAALSSTTLPSPYPTPVPQEAPPVGSSPRAGKVFRDTLSDGTRGPELVVIPAGEFWMGSPEGEAGRFDRERRHRVSIDRAYALGKHEVTFAEYDRFAAATGRDKPDDRGWGRGNRPVINVTWRDAVAYTEWLSQQTGHRYRLPTEAEWEYAARAGTQTAYWWGDAIGRNNANCDGCGSRWDNKQTAPVGSFEANPWGLHDTAGNVWEWTCSAYEADYDGSEGRCISKNNASAYRVNRGGSWDNDPRNVRAALRTRNTPDYRYDTLGFRLARPL